MDNELLGIGLYTIPQASHLTGVSARRINRWINGYSYTRKSGKKSSMQPIWHPDIIQLNGETALSFQDLLEVRFVNAFRNYGVSWKIIRSAAEYAAAEFKDKHPFSSKKFQTDGKWIFEQTVERVIDTHSKQFVFREIISPSLFGGIEFSKNDQALRWFPMHPQKSVVIDPARSFGKPIVFHEGVATEILAQAVKTEKSIDSVARIYDVSPIAVKAAIRFETKLAA